MAGEYHSYLLEFVRGFWDNTPEAMFVVRRDEQSFIVEAANPAQLRELGMDVRDVVGKALTELLPDDLARSITANYECCLLAGGPLRYEEPGMVVNGVQQHYFTQLVPLVTQGDGARHIVGISRNVTGEHLAVKLVQDARQQAEKLAQDVQRLNERLLAANAELEARVAERTLALQKAKEQAEREARHDSLTGCANRRRLLELTEDELARANRYQRPFSLALFDLDHFKAINDRWGHDVGDQVLIALTEKVLAMIRHNDCFGRLGGEEFALLLPETGLDEAGQLLERIREAVAALHWDEHPELQVRVSIGLAAFPGHGETMRDLLRSADRAMYAAKDAGRNRLRVAVSAVDAAAASDPE